MLGECALCQDEARVLKIKRQARHSLWFHETFSILNGKIVKIFYYNRKVRMSLGLLNTEISEMQCEQSEKKAIDYWKY